ncbi:MAG: hypothetical protein Ct9H90mP27_5300 [Gammaproteobacteria bacterium]|nr:MAG: hypothetical protein Ct9H90mP27_5300 [Gammaproteobacteria bacterium]
MNCCMEHRGGVGYEKNTGDGAGILTGIPHKLFSTYAQQEFGPHYCPENMASALSFFQMIPMSELGRRKSSPSLPRLGQDLIGWREVPIDPERRT